MPGQEAREQRDWPLFEGLGEHRVVGVAEASLRDLPCLLPPDGVFVHEQPHQLRDGNRRMGVVQLDGESLVERLRPSAHQAVDPQHVLQGTGHEEILLPQPQPLAHLGLVVRVEHLAHGFREDLLLHGAVVVADIEILEIERLHRLRLPQAQGVARVHAVPDDWRVVGRSSDLAAGYPPDTVAALVVGVAFGAAAPLHVVRDLRPMHLPGVPGSQPEVRDFRLPAVVNFLVEDPELVPDAVADRGDLERGQALHVARGQPAKSAVPQPRFFLVLDHLPEIQTEAVHRLARLVVDAQVDQVLLEVRPQQEFRGEVADDPHVRLVVGSNRVEPAFEQAVADGARQRRVEVVRRRHPQHGSLGVEQVLQEVLGERPALRVDRRPSTADGFRSPFSVVRPPFASARHVVHRSVHRSPFTVERRASSIERRALSV